MGIGASAGGLDAFMQLLGELPADTGMGFVLVQHLDPDHESALTSILARATSLPVREIADGDPVLPDHVHVIPRDTTLSISSGILELEPRQRAGRHRPIDFFFESLARDRRERAVGVVLSGTASDGTIGLEAIKAEGGITFAQDASARHASMPRSAEAAGCVDLVLSPKDIARELARIARHPGVAPAADHQAEAEPSPAGADEAKPEGRGRRGGREDSYARILSHVLHHGGVDFGDYKSSTILRRINRRMVLNRRSTLEDYARFLRGNAAELQALFSDLLINVTSFFRDSETFAVFQHKVLSHLVRQRGDEPLRVWVPGCSTGQEAYSIAMSFVEASEKASRVRKLQIFATDVNEAVLEKARRGLYAASLVEDLEPERLRRFFAPEGAGFRIAKPLREMVVFARQNVVADPPFSRMDFVSCRNLLIYLDPSLQKRVFPTFHYALKPGGFLLLGASESIGGFTDLFAPIDKRHKLYAKKPARPPLVSRREKKAAARSRTPSAPPSPAAARPPQAGPARGGDAQREADRITVSRFAPPGVIVNDDLQILQFRGATEPYLQPPVGKASLDLLKMARDGLMLALRSAIGQARKENRNVRKEGIRLAQRGKRRAVNLEVIPLKQQRERLFLVLFEEEGTAPAGVDRARRRGPRAGEASRLVELEAELAATRAYLESIQEQHEAGNEELQAANEEVQSANEELQSINEELETSKEELESTNEELITVNDELSSRNVELNRLNADLVNLDKSAKLVTLVLGRDLTLRSFSPQAEKQFELTAADVGRPLAQLRHGLVRISAEDAPLDLERLAGEVVAEAREQEREVRDRNGRAHLLRARPYLALDNRVDGAVFLLVDIDALKRSEEAVAAARDYAESIVDTVREPMLVLDGDLRIESANRSFFRTFQIAPADTLGQHIYHLDNHQWDIPVLRRLLEEVVPHHARTENFEVEHEFEGLGLRTMLLNARRVVGPKNSQRTLVAFDDITERKRVERALRESEEQHRTLVEQVKDYSIFRTDTKGRATTWNEGVKDVLGFDRDEFLGQEIGETIFTPEDVRSGAPASELETAARSGTASYERWMRRKNGERFFAAGVTTALRDDRGQLVGFTKVLRDQTARMQAEELLRRSHLDLQESDRRKNEFLAMLGHELRNPLTAVTHGLALLGKLAEDRARAEELRAMIVRQTRRIAALLDQLLDIARLTSGKVEIARQRVDLADVARAAIEAVRPLAEARKHDIVLSGPSSGVFVLGDTVRLVQVVENLLTNAAKYSDEGGTIELDVAPDGAAVRLTVRDHGIGISPDFLPHVFEIFTQAPRSLDRAQGGLGLGLPLVRRLVEMHGGRVEGSSPGLGLGSQFTVELPRAANGVRNGGPKAAAKATAGVRPRRILVVDDEEDITDAVTELLRSDGHSAAGAHDGPSALEAIRTFAPEIVLLDLGLPGMDGWEVARKIREGPGGARIFLVAVTGYQADHVRLEKAGFDRHVIKPAEMAELSDLFAAWEAEAARPT